MATNLQRVVAQDIHQAADEEVVWGQLSLTTLDGKVFRYLVNADGQYVRVQGGGGTAVVAAGVRQVGVTLGPTFVELAVTYRSGRQQQLLYTTPRALET